MCAGLSADIVTQMHLLKLMLHHIIIFVKLLYKLNTIHRGLQFVGDPDNSDSYRNRDQQRVNLLLA